MRKSEITKIANKLGWEFKETKEAAKKLLQEKSIVKDWKEYLRICVEAENPGERWQNVRANLYSQLPEKDLAEIICDWLFHPDPCFSVWAFFNMADRCMEDIIYIPLLGDLHKRKSFLLNLSEISLTPTEVTSKLLCDQFLSSVIIAKNILEGLNRHSLLRKVVSRVGFMAFNITIFRSDASWYALDPQENLSAKELAGTLKEKYISNTNETERKYWLYFVLVETLSKDYGLRGAFRKVAKRLYSSDKTIQRRYFEMKKKFKERKSKQTDFDIRNITAEFYLDAVLDKYLKADETERLTGIEKDMSVNMSVSE